MVSKVSFVVCVIVAGFASQVYCQYGSGGSGGGSVAGSGGGGAHGQGKSPVEYIFNYEVQDQHSGNNFGHQEQRKGANTQGSYYVHLPDGRIQRVTYYVSGNSGFVAKVAYEGEAVYPQTPSQKY